MIQAWLLLPVILGLTSAGWGLLIQRASGRAMRGELVFPVGLAALIAVSRLLAGNEITVKLVTPVAVIVAVAGLVLGYRDRADRSIDPWLAGAATAVFAVFAAPVVLSGSATFAGYGILGDTAVQFVLTDALIKHAGDVLGLGQSAFRQTAGGYQASAYPTGTHAALGAIRPLVGIDVAWAYQPFLAFIAAMLSLSLAGLLRRVVEPRSLRALTVFVAAQPALVYGFALQGSIKELATLWLIPLLVASVAALAGGDRQEPAPDPRALLPVALVSGAMVASVGVAAAVWLGPTLLVALVLVARRVAWRPRALALPVGAFVVLLGLLSLPTLSSISKSVDVQGSVLTSQNELGNLRAPLDVLQSVGVWITGDYRVFPSGTTIFSHKGFTEILIGLALLAAILGIVHTAHRRRAEPLCYLALSLLGVAVVARTGSPWADAKALVIASPAVLLMALVGVEALRRRGRRAGAAAAVLGVALAAGVLMSNALAYHVVSLAPRDRLEELTTVGDRLDGEGPTLSTEFEEFTKHFARDARPVGAAETPTPGLQPLLSRGGPIRFGFPVDLDELRTSDVERFPAVLLRRSPVRSRPPFNYRRTWQGRYYEIWQRRGPGRVLGHLGLGSRQNAAGLPACGQVRRVAAIARARGGTLVASVAPSRAILATALRPRPAAWSRRADDPDLLATAGPGAVAGGITVLSPGRQHVWVRGSFGRAVSVAVDGRPVGAVEHELAQPANWVEAGTVDIRAGRHSIRLARGGGSLAPESGDNNRSLGPVALVPESTRPRLVRARPSRWRGLCGRSFDWIEAVRD